MPHIREESDNMANPYFQFKQFTIWHDKCAMKVGTDGVLLGALAPVDAKRLILDVGAGTGLISLMMAQRSVEWEAHITALELDADAVCQSVENIARTSWRDRITVVQADYTKFKSEKRYDLIVSNPPFFVDSLKSPTANRSQARHTDTLSFESLIARSAELLHADGDFVVIIPTDSEGNFVSLCLENSLHLNRRVAIQTIPNATPKRVVLFFSFQSSNLFDETLLVELERHKYSEAYINLTKEFYLKM